jgi:hypothetical protein
MSTDWLPGKRAEQFEMARTWLAQLPKANGAWTITTAEIDELELRIEAVQDGMYDLEKDIGNKIVNARLKEAFAALTRYMRLIHQRKFFTPPMQDSDWIRLGLRPRDLVRTPHIEVNEVVEFEIKLRGIREILVNFWVKGTAHKAKPAGYDGAVIIWDVLPTPPPDPHSLNRHTMASKTPHPLQFPEESRGQTVYISAAWQNERGLIGNWSEIQSAVIP